MSLSMLCTRINKKHFIKLNTNVLTIFGRNHSTDTSINKNDEIKLNASERVTYPEILDLSAKARRKRERIAWHEEVKKLNTIEEKLIKVNMPKYYGWKMIMLNDKQFPYTSLPRIQHYTRTQFEEGLPKEWNKHTIEELDTIVNSVKEQIEETILYENFGYR